jgi:hypothetical protein
MVVCAVCAGWEVGRQQQPGDMPHAAEVRRSYATSTILIDYRVLCLTRCRSRFNYAMCPQPKIYSWP